MSEILTKINGGTSVASGFEHLFYKMIFICIYFSLIREKA